MRQRAVAAPTAVCGGLAEWLAERFGAGLA